MNKQIKTEQNPALAASFETIRGPCDRVSLPNIGVPETFGGRNPLMSCAVVGIPEIMTDARTKNEGLYYKHQTNCLDLMK